MSIDSVVANSLKYYESLPPEVNLNYNCDMPMPCDMQRE